MNSAETTALKLKSTPTGGVEAAQSPYFRRLMSAGYKGSLQGMISGGSLYGAIGTVIGGIVAAPLLIGSVAAWPVALSLVALTGGIGVLTGAGEFGNIGSTAAINAEAADMSEQRRYLLDRYNELPEGPAGDKEAEAIRQELARSASDVNPTPPPFFHWKTVAVCAAAGALLAFGFMALAPAAILADVGILGMMHTALGATYGASMVGGMGALAGALAGSVVGIDRYYVRKWFDHTENIVHESSHKEGALVERSLQVARLQAAAQADNQTKIAMAAAAEKTPIVTVPAPVPVPASLDAAPVAANDNPPPTNKVSSVALDQRLADIQKAMESPAL